MFLHLCVILFTGGRRFTSRRPASGGLNPGGFCLQGGSASGGLDPVGVCIGVVGQTPHWILWDTVNERAVRILLECILVLYFTNEWLSIWIGYIGVGVQ